MKPPPVPRALGGLAALAALAMAACSSSGTTVDLAPLGSSGVRGTAELTAVDGGTEASVEAEGLPPGTTARVTMHAGTCSLPGASAAPVADLHADAGGRARGSGSILFRGTGKVPLVTIADNDHILVVKGPDRPIACGRIAP